MFIIKRLKQIIPNDPTPSKKNRLNCWIPNYKIVLHVLGMCSIKVFCARLYRSICTWVCFRKCKYSLLVNFQFLILFVLSYKLGVTLSVCTLYMYNGICVRNFWTQVCDNDNGNTMCCSNDLCNNNKTQPTTTTTARKLSVRRENKNKGKDR